MQLFEQQALNYQGLDLQWQPDWLAVDIAEQWFERLQQETPWQQPSVVLYGRTCPVPRLLAWYADAGVSYAYSGVKHEAVPWTPLLRQIRAQVERAAGQAFNSVLLNYYRDGQDSMGWHSDDEPCLGRNPCIASLNLGATRRFDWRRKGVSVIERSLALEQGSLLVMRGATQHRWQHQVAKTRKPCGPRINLTFRLIR